MLYMSLQRPFIDRPAALSAICLSWLGRIWNLGEGGPLCTHQASQHSIFCTATDRSTEYTVLAWCASCVPVHAAQLCTEQLGVTAYPVSSATVPWRISMVLPQEAKYVERWPNTTSAWAGWSRFDIPVDRYGGVHSLLLCTGVSYLPLG
jgi:hypothetical protein